MTVSYVLVAEADVSRVAAYRSLLASASMPVESVRDGAAALALVEQSGPPALLVTELSLPKLDGFQLIERFRKLPGAKETAIVTVSAFRAMRDVAMQRRAELGITSVLAPSMPAGTLQRTLLSALARTEAPRVKAPEPKDDAARLETLEAMRLVDEGPQDPVLEQIVQQTAREFQVPVALVSLILRDRQWFKAYVGVTGKLLEQRGGPRQFAFCNHVVESGEPLVVPDAALHPVFKDNPYVRDGSVRSYAGAPLRTAGGEVLGTLCIVDARPRPISAEEVDHLKLWARRVAGELELRAQRSGASSSPLMDALAQSSSTVGRTTPGAHEAGPGAALLQTLLDQLETGIVLFDHARTILFANAALGRMFTVDPSRLMGQPREAWLNAGECLADDPERFREQLLAPDEGPYAATAEFLLARPSRRVLRWTAKPVPLGSGVGQLAMVTDVTAERDIAAQRERLVLSDFLTGLMNRRGAEEALSREVARARRTGEPLSVGFIDVDHFKSINDSLGHHVGDEVLQMVAARIRSRLRASDLAARWGGDEFLVVLPGAGLQAAREVAESIRAGVAELRFGERRVTLSIGVGTHAGEETSAEMIGRADQALYSVKRDGRNGVAG